MMQIVYFSQKSQLWDHFHSLEGEVEFVAPSPAKADSLRLQLGSAGFAHDVLTIAKFTSNLMNALCEVEEQPEIKRKSELLLIFGILKNKYLPGLGFEQFMQGYNLFSDLRSFTMNHEALASVLDEQPEEVRQAVALFWKLLEATGFLDEHGAYHFISEKLRSAEEVTELKKTFVFMGFQHLNGQQVDLLKALAIRYHVIIPFPLELKPQLKRSDWVTWLAENKVEQVEFPLVAKKPKAQWLKINSREVTLNLKDFLRDQDQVILGVSKLSPLHLDIVPSTKVRFKIPHQLVQAEIQELASDLKAEFRQEVSLDKLESSLAARRVSILKSKDPAFKELKAVELFQEALGVIRELTDEELQLDGFLLKLLIDVVSLNQPRTSFVPVTEQELSIDLMDMSSLQDVDYKRRTIIAIDERFDEVQSLGSNYTEAIQKALSALGPLKRNELELHFKNWELKELFAESDVHLFMSESTLKHSLIWKRLLDGVELVALEKKSPRHERKLSDHFMSLPKKQFGGTYSATKFQSFIDCPRRFYFSYVDEVFPSVALEKDFDSLVSGTISHRIIELFHKENHRKDELPKLIKRVMVEFIAERKLELPREVYLKRELEFNHRALNGITFLEDLKSLLGLDITWKMEEEFEFTDSYKIRGKIDCMGIAPETVLLIDFKSTGSSVPTKKDILNFDNLQLWTYAQAARRQVKDFERMNIILAFVSLDKPADSLLLASSAEQFDKIKLAKICRTDFFDEGLDHYLKASGQKMTSLALAIEAEKDFPALPRTPSACHFCELTKVCVKSKVVASE
jgi:hypothetical protein